MPIKFNIKMSRNGNEISYVLYFLWNVDAF
jgi:hypothetical protein